MTVFSTGTGVVYIRGSVGGNTMRLVGGTTISSKKKSKKKFPFVSKRGTTGISRVWAYLTGAERDSWNVAAASGPLPVGSYTSGYTLFVTYHLIADPMVVLVPGSYPTSISPNEHYDQTVTANSYSGATFIISITLPLVTDSWISFSASVDYRNGGTAIIYTYKLFDMASITTVGDSSVEIFTSVITLFALSAGDTMRISGRQYSVDSFGKLNVWYDTPVITVIIAA